MRKHAQKSWTATSSDHPEQGVYGNGYRIAKMTGGEIQRDHENAILIAAAPDLLEACLRLVSIMNLLGYETDPTTEYAKAAIAKAEGEA